MTLLLLLLLSDVRPLSLATVCHTRWSADHRHVTLAMKRAVFLRDGVPWTDRHHLIIDHVVPRQLSGADTLSNLQIQPRTMAHAKDRDESRLHRAVCRGEMTLAAAQEQMRHWTAP